MKLRLLILVNFSTIWVNGQISITPENLIDTSLNFLYIGVDNQLRISSTDKDYLATISGGGASLFKVKTGHYIVRVTSVTDDCRILLTSFDSRQILLKKQFKVRSIGKAELNFKSGVIKRDSLINISYLSMHVKDCYYKLKYIVLSYDAQLCSDKLIENYSVTGSHFTNTLVNHLKKVDSGAVLTLSNIRALGADDEFRKIPPIVLQIE